MLLDCQFDVLSHARQDACTRLLGAVQTDTADFALVLNAVSKDAGTGWDVQSTYGDAAGVTIAV